MGKVISYPQDQMQSWRQLLLNARTKRAAGDVAGAIALFEEILSAPVRIVPDDVHTAAVLARFDLAIELEQMADAQALVFDYSAVFRESEAGRAAALPVLLALPDFPAAAQLVAAGGTDRAVLQVIFESGIADYTATHAAAISRTKRRVKHLPGFDPHEQMQILQTAMATLPPDVAKEVSLDALRNQDLLPLMRTTLIQWAKASGVDQTCQLTLLGKTYQYNPRFIPELAIAPPTQAILEYNHAAGSPLPDDYLGVLLGLLYPVADQVISTPETFYDALVGGANSADAPLIRWLQQQLEAIN